MVVDSSAVLAILFNEPERDLFSDALADAGVRLMSSVNALEAAVVVSSRKGPYGAREFDLLLPRPDPRWRWWWIADMARRPPHNRIARQGPKREQYDRVGPVKRICGFAPCPGEQALVQSRYRD
ncbi:MAG: type II toxin-antitoxin system VapC family toxin [Chromatiales bacterium]|nr:type II toxin-antitoxin system VapC family toxin [Chromatiales bacterium]